MTTITYKNNKAVYTIQNSHGPVTAAGIVPYRIIKDKVYLLVGKEKHLGKISYGNIGGRIEQCYNNIEELVIDKLKLQTSNMFDTDIFQKLISCKDRIMIRNSKYLAILYPVSEDENKVWNDTIFYYNKIFKNKGHNYVNHKAMSFHWQQIDKIKKPTFILNTIINKMKYIDTFQKYENKDDLFIDDEE